jgi:predicted  nucleic acid-binding Zn-ribbon protein
MSRNRTGSWEERYFKLEEEIQKVKKENKRLKNELEELENRNWWQRLFNIRKEDE